MESSRLVGIGLLLLAGIVNGCSDPGLKADFYDPDRPLFSTQQIISVGGGGHGGINGLLRTDLLEQAFRVAQAGNTALWDSGAPGHASTDLLLTGIFNSDSSRSVLEYAMRCALADGDSVIGGDVLKEYNGDGILSTTTEWTNTPLNTVQLGSVLTCLIAHANERGEHVPIVLNGPAIQGDGVDHSDATMIEAVWLAHVENDPAAPNGISIHYNVWPQDDLAGYCGVNPGNSIVNRTCGNLSPEQCHVIHRTDFSTACTGSDGIYTCDGLPAIQTSLRASDLDLIYPGCIAGQ